MENRTKRSIVSMTLHFVLAAICFASWNLPAQDMNQNLVPIEEIIAIDQIDREGLWVVSARVQFNNPCVRVVEKSITQWREKEFLFLLRQSAIYSRKPCIQKIDERAIHFIIDSSTALDTIVFLDASTGLPIPIKTNIKEGDDVYKGTISEIY